MSVFHSIYTLGQKSTFYPNFKCSKSYISKISIFQNRIFSKIHIFKITFQKLIFLKNRFFKIAFLTKITFSNDTFKQKSRFQNLIFHKNRNFKIVLYKNHILEANFTMIAVSESYFSQKLHYFKYQIKVNLWTNSVILPQCAILLQS